MGVMPLRMATTPIEMGEVAIPIALVAIWKGAPPSR
jgi:hypothetical protein